jgi:hypothetical protein
MKNLNVQSWAVLTLVLFFNQSCTSSVGFSTANQGLSGAQSTSSTGTTPGTGTGTTTPAGATATQQTFKFGALSSAIDILIVDDNSGSMELEQSVMAKSLQNFISGLSGVSWQIGVTTTDITGAAGYSISSTINYFPSAMGRFIAPADLYTSPSSSVFGTSFIITPTTANASTVFANTIQRTNSSGIYLEGSGDERAIYAANMAVTGSNDPTVAQGFFRPNANLAVVILSDEDERSCGNDPTRADCTDGTGYPFAANDYPQSLIDNVSTTFGGTKNLVVDAIVIEPNDATCLNMERTNVSGLGTGGKTGLVYSSLAAMTGGTVSSICNVLTPGAFSTDLTNISNSIANNVNPQMLTLSHAPINAPEIVITSNVAGALVDPTLACALVSGTQQIKCNKYPANSTVTVTYLY